MIVKGKFYFPIGTLRLATKTFKDSSGNWAGKIIKMSELSRSIGEDKSFEVGGLSLQIADLDRFFRNMMAGSNENIDGKKVELLDVANNVLYTGTVQNSSFSPIVFNIDINDKLSGLDKVICDTIDSDTFPNAAAGALGVSIPVVYGYLTKSTGSIKCWRVDTNKYLVSAHHCKDIPKVYDSEGTDISASCSKDNNADGKCYINYTSTDDYILADVKGVMDGSSNLIEEPIKAIKDLIDNYTEMEYDSVSLTASESIMNSREYKIAGAISEGETLENVLSNFCISFDSDFYINTQKKIVINILDWQSLSAEKSFTELKNIDYFLKREPNLIKNRVKYQYDYNYVNNEFDKYPEFSNSGSIEKRGEFYDEIELKFVTDDDTAYDVVQRYVIQRKNPVKTAEVVFPLGECSDLDLGDVIEISHPAGITSLAKKYHIRRINIDYVSNFIRMECIDITTLTGSIFILGDRNTLASTWNEADENERQYGYLCDRDDGYFSNDVDLGKVLY